MLPLPLALSRVLDLTRSVAGAYATMLFADFGAEVILVEKDASSGIRATAPLVAPRLLRNKFACALDVTRHEGLDACLRLAAACDFVFVDKRNVDTGRLTYETFAGARSDVIFVSVGPSAALEAGVSSAGGALTALFHRRATGQGQHVAVETSGTRRRVPSAGPTPDLAPSGWYRCKDAVLTIAVRSREEQDRLRRLIEASTDEPDERLGQMVMRWAAPQAVVIAAEALLSAGVAAQAMLSPSQLASDPHLAARGFFEPVASPEHGLRLLEGIPYRFGLTPAHTRLPAPSFGQHTDHVMRNIAGLSEEDIAGLQASGVVVGPPTSAQ